MDLIDSLKSHFQDKKGQLWPIFSEFSILFGSNCISSGSLIEGDPNTVLKY